MTVDPQVQALCDEFEIQIIPKSSYPLPGQTRAIASIGRLIRNHGGAHARLVLTVLTECKGNHALIDEMALNAVSNLVLACNDMIEEDASAFLDLFDRIPFGPLMVMASELRGIVHQGHALAGMLYLMARRSGSLTGQDTILRMDDERGGGVFDDGPPPHLMTGLQEVHLVEIGLVPVSADISLSHALVGRRWIGLAQLPLH